MTTIWVIGLISGGLAAIASVLRLWMTLRFYRRTYDRGGPDDLLVASQAVNPTDDLPLGGAADPAEKE